MAAPKFAPSAEQSAVIAAGRTKDNFDIIAGAGCAKTTTLQYLAHDQRNSPMIYHAFNASIAKEARDTGKFSGTRCSPMTMHSIAYRTIWRKFESMSLIKMNAKSVSQSRAFNSVQLPYNPFLSSYRVAAMANQTLRNFCNSDDPDVNEGHAYMAMIEAMGDPSVLKSRKVADRNAEAMVKLAPKLVQIARKLYHDAIEAGAVNEDIYMKMLERDPSLIRSAYRGIDTILLDEGQDSSSVQLSILRQSGCRIIRVGDRKQAVYGWRGAVDAFATPNGERLTLSVSYRFPQDIADLAMTAANASPEGGMDFDLVGAGNGQTIMKDKLRYGVISRTNMGVINSVIRLAGKNKAFSLDKGADILREMREAKDMSEGGRAPMSGNLSPFNSWDEVLREADEGGDSDLRRVVKLIEDKMFDQVSEIVSVAATRPMGEERYHCITGHRAKGLEFPEVIVGGGWESTDELREKYFDAETRSEQARIQVAQQFHLIYVLMSRAMVGVTGADRLLAPKPDPAPEYNG